MSLPQEDCALGRQWQLKVIVKVEKAQSKVMEEPLSFFFSPGSVRLPEGERKSRFRPRATQQRNNGNLKERTKPSKE